MKLLFKKFEIYTVQNITLPKYRASDSIWRAVKGVGLRPLSCSDCGFETQQRHGSFYLLSVVFCQVVVIAITGPESESTTKDMYQVSGNE
jgi:hypothetical protein